MEFLSSNHLHVKLIKNKAYENKTTFTENIIDLTFNDKYKYHDLRPKNRNQRTSHL